MIDGRGIWKGMVTLFILGCVASGATAVIIWNIAVWVYHHVSISWSWA